MFKSKQHNISANTAFLSVGLLLVLILVNFSSPILGQTLHTDPNSSANTLPALPAETNNTNSNSEEKDSPENKSNPIPTISQEEIESHIHVAEHQIESNAANTQARQIDCEGDQNCQTIYFQKDRIDERLHHYLDQSAAKVLIEFAPGRYQINDEELEDVISWMREIAKRDGQVSIEAIIMNARESGDSSVMKLPLIGDILQTSWNLYTRIRNYYKYSATENYHAKLLYNPMDKSVVSVYFVHRRYGDMCESLYSRCDVIEYIDDELFDQTLSQRMEWAQEKGYPLRVLFHKTPAYLPKVELNLDRLNKTDSSLRLYKWFVASSETKKRSTAKGRFIGVETAVAAIKYSMQVYDLIQAARMYAPARQMQADIIYEGQADGGEIKSVIFIPQEKP